MFSFEQRIAVPDPRTGSCTAGGAGRIDAAGHQPSRSRGARVSPRRDGGIEGRCSAPDGRVAVLTGSGTAAMEAAVANTVEPGDADPGVGGGQVRRAVGRDRSRLRRPKWRCCRLSAAAGADPEEVAERVRKNPRLKAVFATHNESSTGVLNDMEAIAAPVPGSGGGGPPYSWWTP